jgi:hypothetical protein
VDSTREADPDFDGPPTPAARLRDFDPPGHQRLVVNPFLASLALLAWWCLAGLVLRGAIPPLSMLGTFALALLPRLIRYHCLDCGRSGPYSGARAHACPDVFLRWQAGRETRLPWSSPRMQLATWLWVLGSAGLLLGILLSDPDRD